MWTITYIMKIVKLKHIRIMGSLYRITCQNNDDHTEKSNHKFTYENTQSTA